MVDTDPVSQCYAEVPVRVIVLGHPICGCGRFPILDTEAFFDHPLRHIRCPIRRADVDDRRLGQFPAQVHEGGKLIFTAGYLMHLRNDGRVMFFDEPAINPVEESSGHALDERPEHVELSRPTVEPVKGLIE